jgi:formylmethanofuran dehydrogenase subunit E
VIGLAELLALVEQLHRHLCPRQVLGVRMGMLAGRLLGLALPQRDKRLFVFMETDGCGADGVSVATGCWVGRRTMRMIDFGKVAATFVDTFTGEALRIYPHPQARERAQALLPRSSSRWHAQRDGYQLLPDGDLLAVEAVELRVDLEAIVGRPGSRVVCRVCGEEILNQREVTDQESTLCRACAGSAYYTAGRVVVPVEASLQRLEVP